MKNSSTRSPASLHHDLDHLRTHYPVGTACWFYEAAQQGSGKRGAIKAWELLEGHTIVARMSSGELIPLMHILLDQFEPN